MFGSIFKKKEKILGKLGGINKIIVDEPNNHLTNVKANLWKDISKSINKWKIIGFKKQKANHTLKHICMVRKSS